MNAEVGAWLAKADEDLAAAKCLLDAVAPLPLPAAFHIQQSAEKLLKALLIWKSLDFAKKHDLSYLLELADEPCLGVFADFLERLSPFAVEVRYPGDFLPLNVEQGLELLAILESLRRQVLDAISHA